MITSVQNNKVKQWNKLKKRKERYKSKSFLVEGYHLVEEAYRSNWEIEELILNENTSVPEWGRGFPCTIVSEHVFKTVTDTKTPQGIAAEIKMKQPKLDQFRKILLIDSVQDPGNLGTMIRTADAAGFEGVVLGTGTVDLYNDKVIRATQGSMFHVPVLEKDLIEMMEELKDQDYEIWASALTNSEVYTDCEVPEKVALIMGNEGAGIDAEILERATRNIKIPIYGAAESLNVSVAAGVLMYHIAARLS
nr:RNA methyltransferase [Sediminibacillus massiliensis]